MRSPNIRYIPAIDHLRAYAALLIILNHGLHLFSYQINYGSPFTYDHWLESSNPLADVLIEGHTAVTLFLVLSGFIFTYGVGSDRLRLRGFFRNRFLRTVPMLVFLTFIAMTTYTQSFSIIAVLQIFLGLGNMPGALAGGPFLAPTWTVAIEWQFYFVFPALLLILRRGWTSKVAGMILVLIAFRALAALNGADIVFMSFNTIVGRLDQFLIGMWAANWYRTHQLSAKTGAALAGTAGIGIVAALTALNAAGGWPSADWWRIVWPDLEGVLWAAFIVGYLALTANVAERRWSRFMAAVGKVTYSLYLTHFVIIETMISHRWIVSFTGDAENDALLNTILIALPVTFALATLTYHFIERPFLELRGVYHSNPERPVAPPPSKPIDEAARTTALER